MAENNQNNTQNNQINNPKNNQTNHQSKEPIEQTPEDINRLVLERIKKLQEIRALNINPYPYKFDKKHDCAELQQRYAALTKEERTQDQATIAGRIVALRRMGKITFSHILDGSGKMQLYFSEDALGAEKYDFLKKLDIGDFVGVHGVIFRTKMGELTVHVTDYTLLTKSLRPLPDKFHGLKDVDLRYRKRYLDLIMNPDVRKTFIQRSLVIREIRNFLDHRGFLEVETPTLQTLYGGAAARPFTTHHNSLNMKLYLKISDELYLKRLIIGGFEKVYEIDKDFRNEGIDRNHNPEFTMIEWYEAYTDYNDQMKLVEQLVSAVAKKVFDTTKVDYQGTIIDFSPPWKRITMIDALKEYANVDVDKYDDEEIKQLVTTYNLEYHGDLSRGAIINVLFAELVEDKLIQPTFVIDHPVEVSPLTKIHRKTPGLVERFEVFCCGMEIGNAYSELNDPFDQKNRMVEQEKQRITDEEAHPMDIDFIEALEYGMPPTGGVGIGIDRITMILTNSQSIRDVIFFPTMKHEG
ncbi:lysine--tRNA ligase [Candidatus Woesearchaeota archaeon]|nr:lysine--tRNA ligase [Candidatus Woesearchaeota archaeon]